jgi:hypothetical protein
MTTHITVNGLGLTRKGSIGVSTATLPDVCKTPTPGGPVPIPYPNFANQQSLDKGTTSVKAKGSMIAIKGSEYSISFGDEPGTAGGVTSRTFRKETSWISYSFDVKLDGSNACRHTDKKFHNHRNTVDLAGNGDPTPPPPSYESGIDCEQNKKPPEEGLGWDDCDVAQLCAKVKAVNKMNKKDLLDRQTGNSNKDPAYKRTKGYYYEVFANAVESKTIMSEAFLDSAFYHPCAKEKWEKAGRNPRPNSRSLGRNAFQADHIHDCQLGCNLGDITNFKMLSQSVNGAIGPSLASFDPDLHPGGISLPKCDCP